MMRYTFLALAAAASGTIASPALAQVTFSEAASGDVDAFTATTDAFGQPSRNLIPLGVGTNTFAGSIASPGDSADVIPFQVLTGQRVSGFSFSISNVGINNSARFDLENLFGEAFLSQDLGNISSPNLILGPGLYSLLIGGGVNVLDYNLSFNVEALPGGPGGGGPVPGGAVPEPSTWAMLLVGFAGIGAAMRRRRTIATTVTYA